MVMLWFLFNVFSWTNGVSILTVENNINIKEVLHDFNLYKSILLRIVILRHKTIWNFKEKSIRQRQRRLINKKPCLCLFL